VKITPASLFRQWWPVAKLLVATATVIAAVGLLNFLVDPLQLFRNSKIFPAFYTSNDREQAAGLIRSQNFDTVFMGTSLAVHFRASEISKASGWRVVKLAISGSTSEEQSFVLEAAMQREPERVLWQMDDWIFRNPFPLEKFMPVGYYRRTIAGWCKYLLSLDTMRESLGIAARSIPGLERRVIELTWIKALKFYIDNVDDINSAPRYLVIHDHYNSTRALASFAQSRAMAEKLSSRYDYDTMVQNFERDAFSLIRRHPEVHFTIYFAPYSILYYVTMRDVSPPMLQQTYRLSAHIMTRLATLPNVTMYDFRDAAEITHNLENYADVMHHSPEIDAEIIRRLGKGQNHVDSHDPLASLRRLQQQVADYSSQPLAKLPEQSRPENDCSQR
jgi:hypothetical protein